MQSTANSLKQSGGWHTVHCLARASWTGFSINPRVLWYNIHKFRVDEWAQTRLYSYCGFTHEKALPSEERSPDPVTSTCFGKLDLPTHKGRDGTKGKDEEIEKMFKKIEKDCKESRWV